MTSAVLNKDCLIDFCRGGSSLLAEPNAFPNIVDLKDRIGIPPSRVIASIASDEDCRAHLSAFLRRLRAFPDNVVEFVNLEAMQSFIRGDVHLPQSDCVQLISTMTKFPHTCDGDSSAVCGLLKYLLDNVASPNIELSEVSGELVGLVLRSNMGSVDIVSFAASALASLANQHAADSTVLLRYASLVCSVAGPSNSLFPHFEDSGAMDLVLRLCHTEDELVQIVALEFLDNVYRSERGLLYMIERGHIQWLIRNSCQNDMILSTFALRSASTFFASIADITVSSTLLFGERDVSLGRIWDGQQAALASDFISAVMLHMDSTSDASRLAALSAISTFASSSLAALSFVAGVSKPDPAEPRAALGGATILDAWMDMLRLKMEIQAVVLKSVSAVLVATQALCETDIDFERHAESMLAILRRIGDIKKSPTMNFLLALAKGALKKGWGIDLLFRHSEFTEYLMDQGSESTYESKEFKFSIITAVLSNPCCQMLSEPIQSKLKAIREQGPHYLPAQMRELKTLEL